MAVHVDIIEGLSGRRCFSQIGQKIWEFSRQAKVTGLIDVGGGGESAAAATGAAKLESAVDALIAIVGDIGSPLSLDRPYCLLREFNPEAESVDCVKIRFVYRDTILEATHIEVGAAVSQVETNLDANGNPIFLSYTYPSDYENEAFAGKTIPQGGMYTKLVPEVTARFQRLTTSSPLTDAETYVGRTNSATFLGLTANSWLCTSIIGRSDDDGVTYSVSYEFQARVGGWVEHCVFICPDTGKPPPDIDSSATASADVEPYDTANFSTLGLT